MRMAARPASIEPSAHEAAVTRFGLRPFDGAELGVVDHGPHGDAEARAPEQQPQAEGHADGGEHRRDLVPRDHEVDDGDAAVAPQAGDACAARCPRSASARPWNASSSASVTTSLVATDAPRSSRRMTRTSRRTPMIGAHDAEGHEQGERRRPAPVDAQLPVHEREEHPDGAVGEVEDARGDVGDDEPGGRDGVDRGDGDAEDQEREERLQVHAHPPVATPGHPSQVKQVLRASNRTRLRSSCGVASRGGRVDLDARCSRRSRRVRRGARAAARRVAACGSRLPDDVLADIDGDRARRAVSRRRERRGDRRR